MMTQVRGGWMLQAIQNTTEYLSDKEPDLQPKQGIRRFGIP